MVSGPGCCGRDDVIADGAWKAGAGCVSGGVTACSGSLLLPMGRPKRRSREAPLPWAFGGGGNEVLALGSGEGR